MRVDVDKDIIDFLKAIYFGDYTNTLQAASNRAYRDMNRTIRFKSLSACVRVELREQVYIIFNEEIKYLVNGNIKKREDFDEWHCTVCTRMKEIYANRGILLTYGQAQKWLNMTIKYLYILEAYTFEDVFDFLHIPLDNYVFDIANDVLNVDRPTIVWSKWDDYEKQYLAYQKKIREQVRNCEPMRWEFRYWLKAARNVE